MDFFKLLKLYDFDPKKAGNIVLVRHIPDDDKPEVAKYIKHSSKNFEMWQRIQCKENPPKNGNQPTRNQGAGFWKPIPLCPFAERRFMMKKMHARFAGVFHNHSGDSPEVLLLAQKCRRKCVMLAQSCPNTSPKLRAGGYLVLW